MAKNNISEAKPNTIVAGTRIKGEIKSNGDFRIDGELTGSIICKGKIVVGQTGMIDGEIECQNADLSGNVIGKVVVEQLLALKSTAKMNGDVITSKISIEPGATFTGTCSMEGSGVKNTPADATKIQEKSKEKLSG